MRTAPVLGATLVALGCAAGVRHRTDTPAVGYAQFTETIEGTAVEFVMKPVPGGGGIDPFWIGETEVTWDAYDVYLFGLDEPGASGREGGGGRGGRGGADAVTRPSKPYILMDRGFGHAGHPAISMSYHAAASFCRWLSGKTRGRYLLPTEAQWRHACGLGAVDPARLGEHAWYRENAGHRTHPVATKAPDGLGLSDLRGNASEWCTGSDGAPVTLGGCYLDPADDVGCGSRVPPSAAWNDSDPQLPKSIWWLADGGFVGFRLVCEPDDSQDPGEER